MQTELQLPSTAELVNAGGLLGQGNARRSRGQSSKLYSMKFVTTNEVIEALGGPDN